MSDAAGPVAARTVAAKLQVKAGDPVAVSGTAEERALLGELPAGTSDAGLASAAVTIAFVHDRADLLQRFADDLPRLDGARAVWYVYRKGRADLNRDTIMREAGAFGWRAISNIAVDGEWSAVRVRPLAEGEAPLG